MTHSFANSAINTLFRDKHGKVVIIQWPNIPILGWLVTKIISFVISKGRVHDASMQLSIAFIFTWAYLELTSGVNLARKLLGAIVLAITIASFFEVR